MTEDERCLLLTVARVFRAHLRDAIDNGELGGSHMDFIDMCDALKPFDPSDAAPVNEEVAAPPSPQGDHE